MRMWKLAKVAAAVVVGALGLANMAKADTVKWTVDSYGTTGGGEFVFKVVTGLVGTGFVPGDTWRTFCVETDEHIALGKTYTAVLATEADGGGAGGPSPDPLSPKTAYLFTQFSNGTLAGYNYGTGALRVASADALQRVIWGIEEELGALWTPAAGLQTTFYNAATASGWTNIGNVRVVQLTSLDAAGKTIKNQDILVVPVPAAAWMGLALLGGVGATRAIRRRQA